MFTALPRATGKAKMNLQSITPAESNVLRVETLATRITSEEMRAVKTAARNSGSSCSEWLREAALAYLQEPIETSNNTPIKVTILEEVMGLRLLMVNLFAGATPGLALQNVHQIIEYADSAKYNEAAKVMRRSSESRGTK
jgi:hypothetical protein